MFINGIINFGIDYYDDEKEYIEDIPVQNLEKNKILKQKLGRKKDIEDLKHIPDNL